MISDNRKLGTGLLALGGIFLFLGMLFFFDSALLAMGTILFSRLVWPQSTYCSISRHAAVVVHGKRKAATAKFCSTHTCSYIHRATRSPNSGHVLIDTRAFLAIVD